MIDVAGFKNLISGFLFFSILVYLTGCVSDRGLTTNQTPSGNVTSPGLPDDKAVIVPKPDKPVYIQNAALKNLMDKSDSLIGQKRYDSAIQELERGLSFAPNNPFIWQKMAEARLQQGQYGQAEQLARKSNALSQGNDELRLKNWQIIAAAKKAQQ